MRRKKGFGEGKSEEYFIKVTKKEIAELLGVSVHTLRYWRKKEGFNPRDLKSVCDKYVERLDKLEK